MRLILPPTHDWRAHPKRDCFCNISAKHTRNVSHELSRCTWYRHQTRFRTRHQLPQESGVYATSCSPERWLVYSDQQAEWVEVDVAEEEDKLRVRREVAEWMDGENAREAEGQMAWRKARMEQSELAEAEGEVVVKAPGE